MNIYVLLFLLLVITGCKDLKEKKIEKSSKKIRAYPDEKLAKELVYLYL